MQAKVPATRRPGPSAAAAPPAALPSAHASLVCVALPAFVVSAEHGQLDGTGLEGFYHGGRRLLSRCQVRVSGAEPLAVQGRMTAAGRARFVATVRTGADPGPDPDVTLERLRDATGLERLTLTSSATRPLRLQLEAQLGTDLAELGAIAAGAAGGELAAGVWESGLRWTTGGAQSVVTANPPPDAAVASAGLLRWELQLPPGGRHTIELRVGPGRTLSGGPPVDGVLGGGGHGGGAAVGGGHDGGSATGRSSAGGFSADGRQPVSPPPRGPIPWSRSACAGGDDARVAPALASALDDLGALLLRDPGAPVDGFLASGVPWRCGLDPADALWAARMLLPLGTDLAAGTLRALARSQQDRGPQAGLLPGPVRTSGPQLPPRSVGIEATLLFPAVLAEARRWGLSGRDTEQLLPTAERCLAWLRSAAPGCDPGAQHHPADLSGYVPDPAPGGPYRCETQAHAHRAALLGADLLDEFGRPGADGWREWAAALRERFRADFWVEDRSGGRPAAALKPDGDPLPQLGSAAAHLLDSGLSRTGQFAEPLLDKVRAETLARLLGAPAQDCGWGLRSLGRGEPRHNPFGHGGGAVRVLDTAVAVAGLFATGYEKEAGFLLHGTLDAAAHFGHRLPEMYAGIQRTEGGAPLPHPAACRPAATAAASVVHLLTAVTGLRPDVPAGTVTIRPASTAPLGALHLTGWQIAGEPFSVRVSRLGMGMVEEAAAGLQLGT